MRLHYSSNVVTQQHGELRFSSKTIELVGLSFLTGGSMELSQTKSRIGIYIQSPKECFFTLPSISHEHWDFLTNNQ